MDILEEKNIKLRAVEPADADLIYEWENDSSVWHAGNTIEPFSRYIINEYVKNAHLDLIQCKQLRLMIDLKSEEGKSAATIGSVDLFEIDTFHQKAGVGILIHKEEHRKKGYAGQALEVIIRYAFDVLLLHQIYCNIDEDNIPSLNLFKRKGFEVTGNKKDWIRTKNGWKNELFLQLINTNQ